MASQSIPHSFRLVVVVAVGLVAIALFLMSFEAGLPSYWLGEAPPLLRALGSETGSIHYGDSDCRAMMMQAALMFLFLIAFKRNKAGYMATVVACG